MEKDTAVLLVKVLAWVHIVFAALGIIAAFVMMFFGPIFFGLFLGVEGAELLGGLGAVFFIGLGLFTLALSILQIIAGVQLLKFKNWARWVIFILSILSILSFPIGTAVGVIAIWVLVADDNAKKLFS